MQVELFKKLVPYVDQNGVQKTATNFYAKCGTELVPIEVTFFADKTTGEDRNYRARKTVLSAFAEELPEREDKKGQQAKPEGK